MPEFPLHYRFNLDTDSSPSRYKIPIPIVIDSAAPTMAKKTDLLDRLCESAIKDRDSNTQILICMTILFVAFGLRYLVHPLVDEYYPFFSFSLATVVITWFCGWKPGVLSMISGGVLASAFFKVGLTPVNFYGECVYCFNSGTVIIIVHSMRQAMYKTRIVKQTLQHQAEELRRRGKQQEMVSRFGIASLTSSSFDEWLNDVMDALIKTLRVDYSKVLELQPNEGNFIIRAGYGWEPGVVGNRTIQQGNTQAGYTLQKNIPIIVEDYRKEKRFEHGYLFTQYGIISGVTTVIPGSNGPWGILGVHCKELHSFSLEDIYYLQCVANLIGEVLERSKLADDLEHKLNELASSDRRKDEFLAMLAHELRNPLAPIQNAVNLLGLESSPEMVLESRQMITRNLDHMVRLVDDLLDVSRIMRGKIELKREPVSVRTVVDRAIEQVRPLINSMDHALTVSFPEIPIIVDADPIRLSQIVANLLNNAAKYTDRGGKINLKVEMSGTNSVLITVEDNGIGIAPELLPSIFELFVQADQALDRSHGGLGIGLALVLNLVHMHDGTVGATSVLGQGSKFTLRLPARQQKMKLLTAMPGAKSATTGQRILVVDDNEDNAISLGKILQVDGHTVALAFTGDSAILVAVEFSPDVVLLDIGLPGKSGYEVATYLRSLEKFHHTYLIAMTGYGRDEDKVMATSCGFDKHLTKPVKYEMIRDLLIEAQSFKSSS